MEKKALLDNDDRRLGNDRRIFSYSRYFPERRSGENRRLGLDECSTTNGVQLRSA